MVIESANAQPDKIRRRLKSLQCFTIMISYKTESPELYMSFTIPSETGEKDTTNGPEHTTDER
jgi:hypothetical protein